MYDSGKLAAGWDLAKTNLGNMNGQEWEMCVVEQVVKFVMNSTCYSYSTMIHMKFKHNYTPN